MAFNLVDLITAIRTRLEASDSSTFRGGFVYPFRAPPGLGPTVGALPLVTFIPSWEPDDSFESDGYIMNFTVTIVDHIENTAVPMMAAYQRVFGDADPPATDPTYGLHRHTPVLVGSDNSPGMIRFVRGDTLFEEDTGAIGIMAEFTLNIDKVIPEA